MTGTVDNQLRALLGVTISASQEGPAETVRAWIDTAFNGGLVLPAERIAELGLQVYSSTPATLADGQTVELPTYTCYLDWFGELYRTQVVANRGEHPLLGTSLLDGREPFDRLPAKDVDTRLARHRSR